MPLRDKVILLTGASSGIGAALARQLLTSGAYVVLAARRAERCHALVGDRERALVVPTDVTVERDRARLVATTIERFGHLDVLVNNAGLGLTAPVDELSADDIDRLIRLDLVAPIQLTRLALPHLRHRERALIVNVSSMSALATPPFQSVYAAAKRGLAAFSEALSRDLYGSDVRVLTVFPGVVETEQTAGFREGAAAHGIQAPIHSAERAARQIARAMTGRRRRVVVGGPMERVLAWLGPAWPGLLDRVMASMRGAMVELSGAPNEHARRSLGVGASGESPSTSGEASRLLDGERQ